MAAIFDNKLPALSTSGFMTGFVEGYQGITRAKALEEETDYRREMTADLKKKRADEVRLRDLQSTSYLLEKGEFDAIPKHIADEILANVQDNPESYRLFGTPQNRALTQQKVQQLGFGMQDPQQNWNIITDSANYIFNGQFNQGLADDGRPARSKDLARVFPSPNGDGSVFAELNVTRQDGSTYRAPMTSNRTADPYDTLAPIDPSNVFKSVGMVDRLNKFISYIESRRVALGDTKPIEDAKERRVSQQISQAMEGIDRTRPVPEQRQEIFKRLSAIPGINQNVIAQTIGVIAPEDKPYVTEVGAGGDSKQVMEFSGRDAQGNPIWKPVGQPIVPYHAPSGGGGKENPDDKFERLVLLDEFKSLSKQEQTIVQKMAAYKANMNKEITETGELGITTKKTVTQADLESLGQQLQETRDRKAKLSSVLQMDKVDKYYNTPKTAIDTEDKGKGGDKGDNKGDSDTPPKGYTFTGRTANGGRPVFTNPNDPNGKPWLGKPKVKSSQADDGFVAP